MSWIWTAWLLTVIVSFAVFETWALKTGKLPSLSRFTYDAYKAWPPLAVVYGLLFGGLAVWLVFLGCLARCEGVGIGGPLLNGDRGNLKPMNRDSLSGVSDNVGGAGWHRIQDDMGRLAGDLGEPGSGSDRSEVKNSGPAGNQHQVSGLGCGKGDFA